MKPQAEKKSNIFFIVPSVFVIFMSNLIIQAYIYKAYRIFVFNWSLRAGTLLTLDLDQAP